MGTLSLKKEYKPYPEYKDSGVEWLGQVPQEWSLDILQHLFYKIKRTGHEGEEILSVYRDRGVIIKSSRDDNHNKASDDLSLYQLVQPGDLAINKMKAWQGSVAVSAHRGIVSPAYFVFRALTNNDSSFLHYLLRSSVYIKQYERHSGGVRNNQWDLSYEQFRKLTVSLPPIKDQKRIAAYINNKTAFIDQIIEKKQELIKLLQEKRAAIITKVVTKGLNPNVELVESGVEWAAKLPKHWSIQKLKYHTDIQEGPGILGNDFRDEGVPLLRIRNLKGPEVDIRGCNFVEPKMVDKKWSQFRLEKGDLLISGSASSGVVSEVGECAVGAIPYTGLIKLTPKGINHGFLKIVLGSPYFNEQIDLQKTGTAMQHFGPTHLKKVTIALPSEGEQLEISRYLEQRTSEITGIIKEIENTIKLTKEFKSSLISHAVTGKIKI